MGNEISRQPKNPLLPGQRFGKLTVVEFADYDKHGAHLYHCRCDCGNETTVAKSSLTSGRTKSCGCARLERKPKGPLQHGQRFGKLTVIEYAGRDRRSSQLYLCQCDCGNETTAKKNHLVSGYTKSCGCSRSERELKNPLQPGQRFGKLTVVEFAGHDKHSQQIYRCRCDCRNEITVQKGSLVSGATKSCGCLRKSVGPLQPGQRFGRLTVIEFAGRNKHRQQIYRCQCDCGNETTVYEGSLTSGVTKSCGCLRESVGPLQSGQRFGRLTVIEYAGRDKNSNQIYRCRCDCGNETTVTKSSLTSGSTKSCGCSRQKSETRLRPGQRFGMLTVIEYAGHDEKFGIQLYRCRCDCGNETTVLKYNLTSGKTKSCGCIRLEKKPKNPLQPGQRFGKLTVIEFAGFGGKYHHQLYRCRCDCGNKVTVAKGNLLSGGTRSCGCLRSQKIREHSRIMQPYLDSLDAKETR